MRRLDFSSLIWISTNLERPTVSIQNGRPTRLTSSWLRAWSSSEKNCFGFGEGRGPGGRMAIERSRAVGGYPRERRIIVGLRIILQNIDDGRNVAHRGARQPGGHPLPVTFHEHEGDHGLQDHDRQHDDQQRARVEPLRQQTRKKAARPRRFRRRFRGRCRVGQAAEGRFGRRHRFPPCRRNGTNVNPSSADNRSRALSADK